MLDSGSLSTLAGFLEATVRIATPLGLAALGETVTERSGVINVGLEGAMLGGALAAAMAAHWAGSPWAGVMAGCACGAAIAAVFAVFAVVLRGDQIVVGTAITLAAVGATGAVYRAAFGVTGTALSLPTLAPLGIPGLASIPVVGAALFRQSVPTYLLYMAAAAIWVLFARTQLGLAIRSAGESPAAAEAAGLRVARLRFGATLFGGAMAGLAGATLVLAQAGTFAERMTAGRGFVAIAIVVLGRWRPLGVFVAALVFGAASALQFAFQAIGLDVPYQFFLMAPYVVSLLALAGAFGRAQAPETLGRNA
ncbi:MAG: ABC transporter permease [Gemmatimonadales bacterium]